MAHCSAEPFLHKNIFHLFIKSLRLIKRCNIASLPKLCLCRWIFILKSIHYIKRTRWNTLHCTVNMKTGYSTWASAAEVRKVLSSSPGSLTVCWVELLQRMRHRKAPWCIRNKSAATSEYSQSGKPTITIENQMALKNGA